jgi:hypothetical protein
MSLLEMLLNEGVEVTPEEAELSEILLGIKKEN